MFAIRLKLGLKTFRLDLRNVKINDIISRLTLIWCVSALSRTKFARTNIQTFSLMLKRNPPYLF